MKTIKSLLIIMLVILTTSCGTILKSSANFMKVHQGMNKEQVISIMGQPNYRSFDGDYENWEYRTSIYGGDKVFVLNFYNDALTKMDSYKDFSYDPQTNVLVPPMEDSQMMRDNPNYIAPQISAQEARFQDLYNRMKNISFESDQIKELQLAVNTNKFTCSQCVKLLSLRSFEDQKLKFLKIMAPCLIDKENYGIIIDSFAFMNGKDGARDILLKR